VTEPMRGTIDRSMFRRISWAPDGASLCVSAAAKATKPIGVVLRRGTWEPTADLVGHQAQAVSIILLFVYLNMILLIVYNCFYTRPRAVSTLLYSLRTTSAQRVL
jgi:hypothetical protein